MEEKAESCVKNTKDSSLYFCFIAGINQKQNLNQEK